MTIDKFIHYLGKEQVVFISSQNLEKLEKMKNQILYEINNIKLDTKTMFKYTIELQLIKDTIKLNK